MPDRTTQEDLLVIEALVEFGYRHLDNEPERARHAWVLAAELALSNGRDPTEALQNFAPTGDTLVACE